MREFRTSGSVGGLGGQPPRPTRPETTLFVSPTFGRALRGGREWGMAHSDIDLDTLSPQEQLELLDRLWERLGRNPDLLR